MPQLDNSTEPVDLAQAAYLEIAALALAHRDLPLLIGAVASLKSSSLDQIAGATAHPAWAALADHALNTSRKD
jgi:hypothetical protein